MARPFDTHAEFWAKFWFRVDTSGDCWLWKGKLNHNGYGRVAYRGVDLLAHRVMLFWFGRIQSLAKMRTVKEGITLHSCDNRACVNPAHLSVGTARQNMLDMYQRNRVPSKGGELGPLAKLTNRDAVDILLAASVGVSRVALAEKFGVNRSSIDNVVRGKSFKQAYATFQTMTAVNNQQE